MTIAPNALDRAPRKYKDADRTEVTHEWLAWRERRNENRDRFEAQSRTLSGDEYQRYFPEDYDKHLGEGRWVFVIDPPHGVAGQTFHVPLLSIWYARPHQLSTGRIAGRHPYQGVIQTPQGDLHLWPHEYALVSDVRSLLGFEGVEIHSLGGDPVLDQEQLFYLTSRGIPREEAVIMLFDQIKSQNYCYVTLPDYAVAMFAGVGTSLRSHISKGRRSHHDQEVTP